MNKLFTLLCVSVLATLASANPPKATVIENTSHARDYDFTFTHGNLLPNWSFEDGFYAWNGKRLSRTEITAAYGQEIRPVSGSYVGMTSPTGGPVSDFVPVDGDSVYTLSLFAYNVNKAVVSPRIYFYSDKGVQASYLDGKKYTRATQWSPYSHTFNIPEGTRYIRISLSDSSNSTMFFDDVILEPGKTASTRNSVGMGISFSDGLGRGHMAEALVHREFASELLPSECMNGFTAYATEILEVRARSKSHGGNLGSGDSIFIDNDVNVRDTSLSELGVVARNSVRMGDRDSVFAKVSYGRSLWTGNQTFVQQSVQNVVTDICAFPPEDFPIGTSDVSLANDADSTLVPGKYGNGLIRARSTLRFSAGDYYFDTFFVEPSAILRFDLSQGNVVMHVRSSLSISDNSIMSYDSTSRYFIGWRLAQSSTLRLGTISGLAGVFVAPNAKIELGHQSALHGLIYAKNVELMQESDISASSFLFFNPAMRFIVKESRYDNLGRAYQEDYSYVAELEREGYVDSSLIHANDYFSQNGDGPDAAGYAYLQNEYSLQDGRLLKSSMPGEPWKLDGTHVGFSDYAYVADLNIPQSLDFSKTSTPKNYTLSYSRNVEGRLSLSWKNLLGQLVQTAFAVDTSGLNMRNWHWAIKKYEYTREGNLRRTITPLDADQNDSAFAVVSDYDAAGRNVSTEGPDVGTEKFYYTKSGSVRISVTEEQRGRNAVSYKEYDAQGRIVSIGESILDLVTDARLRGIAKSQSPVPGVKTEYSGSAYDSLSACLDRINNDRLEGYFVGRTLKNTRGKLACAWTRNPLVVNRIGADAALVADFFSYDSLGRKTVSIRYTGAEIDSTRRVVLKNYEYDNLSRLYRVTVANADGSILDIRRYSYDDKGRIDAIRDDEGLNIVKFTYDDLEQVSAVKIGDRLETDYAYHLHGQVTSLNIQNTVTGDTLFRQTLNYEDVTASANEQPRYDGMISRLSTIYGIADSSGNRVSTFLYDMPGNMVKRSGSAPEATFSFDKNGRMLTQGYGGNTLGYNYYDGSYRLNRVTGTIALDSARNASRTDNFTYDASGRMIADSSKSLSVEYDPYGMPVSFVQTSDSSTWREVMIYDPSSWRVATFVYENDSLQAIRTDIMAGGKKILERRRAYVANDSSVTEYKMITGKSGIVGRILPDSSKEWYVKDYQGSLVMTLVENGTGNVLSYEPYGAQKKIKVSGDSPAEQYTGKELNERVGLYYYGARYFDPVLGIWISPDAVKQFDNPFHFGENPINYVDKDGNLAIPIVIIPFLSTITVYVTIYQEEIFSFLNGLISGYDSGHGLGYDGKVDFWGFVGAEIGANAHNIVESDELPHETLLGNVAKNLENGPNSFVKGWNQVGMAMENGIMFMGESIVEDGLWLADAGEKMLFDFNTTSNSGITNSIFISQFQGTSSGFQPTNLVIGTTAPKDLNKSTSYKNYSYEYERNINTTNTDFNKPLEQVQHSIDQVQNPINNIDIEIQIPEIKIDNDYQDIMNGINSDLENIRHSNKCYIGCNGYTNF
ncbi:MULTISPECIES: RHS repeat domain-containing protein [unclassified Fibrobacter]|uniref:RHS repeat domain-containing protein n=1 Tax=unclassified Fibrobacter TaxID=2634177 RepID=UPI000D6AC2AA|nr:MULTISPECIES: RHS repeat-associated core domain-containing protein [unclassified Fibrobacter]PWJ56681.1 RHS repeat-associated protein [Fibrobacter sp. UWR4]PZW62338.1 RHS repeat-associated protein [Fibrobacter sp. UWR1]